MVLACRSEGRGTEALERIRAEQTKAVVHFSALDLADLENITAFVARFKRDHTRLDLLINHAGVMVPPESKTAQGFELQIEVNTSATSPSRCS